MAEPLVVDENGKSGSLKSHVEPGVFWSLTDHGEDMLQRSRSYVALKQRVEALEAIVAAVQMR